jgi:endogenous inhibitor of DNA gyrase (YacG/DUF329 family)
MQCPNCGKSVPVEYVIAMLQDRGVVIRCPHCREHVQVELVK